MSPFRTALALALLGAATLLLAPMSAAAQQQTPAEVAKAAFDAIAQKRWSDAAALVDSAAAVRLRHQRIERVWSISDHPPRPSLPNPSLPQCVADYFAAKGTRNLEMVRREALLGLDSAEELEQLTARELVARFLEYNDQRSHMARSGGGAPPDLHVERKVLGQVIPDDTMAYVVYSRIVFYGPTGTLPGNATLLALVRRADGWRIADVNQLNLPGMASSVVFLRSSATIVPPRKDSIE